MPERHDERRQYTRFELACRTMLVGETDGSQAEGQTLNVCDGGALVLVPSDATPAVDSTVEVKLHVPAGNGKTRVCVAKAQVLHHMNIYRPTHTAVAVKFHQPQSLTLDRPAGQE